jgi:phage baseplate assembly protein gpV
VTDGLIASAAREAPAPAAALPGVVLGLVLDNLDAQGLHRVLVRILPGIEAWAPVAVPAGGPRHGTYFIPQRGDQVVVAFVNGDARAPVVIGSVWARADAVPVSAPTDAVTRRVVRTPAGHELVFDDATLTVRITTSTGQTVVLDPLGVEVAAGDGKAKLRLDSAGLVTLEGAAKLELKAPLISLDARVLELKGSQAALLDGGNACVVQAQLVKIN